MTAMKLDYSFIRANDKATTIVSPTLVMFQTLVIQ